MECTSFTLVVSSISALEQPRELTVCLCRYDRSPKGVLREAAGHAVGLNLSIKYLFGIHGPGDVMFALLISVGW
jgi:hypothetical protein